MKRMIGLAAAVALVAGGTAAQAKPGGDHARTTARNRAVMAAFAEQFYGRRDVRGAFERFVVPDYIQHNPGLPDGREPAIEALRPKFEVEGARFEVKRILVDGDLAMIHLRARPDAPNGGGAVADIYRLKDGKIVEHWDVIQPWPKESKNPHPMF